MSCLSWQFIENPQNKQIFEENKERIRRTLLNRVPLEGIVGNKQNQQWLWLVIHSHDWLQTALGWFVQQDPLMSGHLPRSLYLKCFINVHFFS